MSNHRLIGTFLRPITFYGAEREQWGNLYEVATWTRHQCEFGKIVAACDHSSICTVNRSEGKARVKCESPMFLSKDGLVAFELPQDLDNDLEALLVASNHINSFLANLNFAGLFHMPVTGRHLMAILQESGELSLKGGSGDQYVMPDFARFTNRLIVPKILGMHETDAVDWNAVPNRFVTADQISAYAGLGRSIRNALTLEGESQILSLEAMASYVTHNWNSCILLGWAFIENVIENYWMRFVTNPISELDKERVKRLSDTRTYGMAIKIEILFVQNLFDQKVYDALNAIRKARNDLVHKGNFCSEKDATLIFTVLNPLLVGATNLPCGYRHPGMSWSGGWVEKGTVATTVAGHQFS